MPRTGLASVYFSNRIHFACRCLSSGPYYARPFAYGFTLALQPGIHRSPLENVLVTVSDNPILVPASTVQGNTYTSTIGEIACIQPMHLGKTE